MSYDISRSQANYEAHEGPRVYRCANPGCPVACETEDSLRTCAGCDAKFCGRHAQQIQDLMLCGGCGVCISCGRPAQLDNGLGLVCSPAILSKPECTGGDQRVICEAKRRGMLVMRADGYAYLNQDWFNYTLTREQRALLYCPAHNRPPASHVMTWIELEIIERNIAKRFAISQGMFRWGSNSTPSIADQLVASIQSEGGFKV